VEQKEVISLTAAINSQKTSEKVSLKVIAVVERKGIL
jgi:hypothetical protein